MTTNVLIRFESDSGKGIYYAKLDQKAGLEQDLLSRHPLPQREDEFDDICFSMESNARFCFNSVEKLLNWFSINEINKLVAIDEFQIRLVRASRVVSSSTQSVFWTDTVFAEKIIDKYHFLSILEDNPTWMAQEEFNKMLE